MLSLISTILERIAFNDDPLKFMLLETTYHPIISLLSMFDITKEHPELQGIRKYHLPSTKMFKVVEQFSIANYGSALVIELRRGAPPEDREFLRFKFMNGSSSALETVHVFGHKNDIPLTEFIYKTEV